jgi:lipopolysaccharide transport system ATP-binding protein
MQPGIEFLSVSKKFRRGERRDSFRDLIPSLLKPRASGDLAESEFWALRDVSFSVGPGQSLGIIGPNGAGKSTILKLLTRILAPTSGRCRISGRAGALIEVSSGFHQDLTGRENVYLQGAIMGMRRADISRNFDRIVEFSGIGDFIDTPVKRYSSGMNARLGFSIAAHLDPDVLIIDEVLSVGDAVFQDQCVARMRELAASGVPLVFVSHNLPAVMDLCERAILLVKGRVAHDGPTASAIREYRSAAWVSRLAAAPNGADSPIRIVGVQILDEQGRNSCLLRTGDFTRIRILYDTTAPVHNPQFAVDLTRDDGTYCSGLGTRLDRWQTGLVDGQGAVDLVIPRLMLLRGSYLLSVGIHDASGARPYDLQMGAYPFSVLSDRRDLGAVCLEHEWAHVPSARAGYAEEAVS